MAERSVVYVLKGWPRASELFIASEIWRLEQLGVPLRLVVLKPPDETVNHPVVDRVAAVPVHLPEMTSLRAQPLPGWLWHNAGPYLPALRRVARRHPWGLARAAATALAQSVRARTGWHLRTLYAKELLQAVAVADQVAQAGDVGHLHAHFAHGTTTVTWLASRICGVPFSFTGHAKDIWRPSLNPAGLLRRKVRAAAFVLTCTAANATHLRALAPGARVHLAYHGLNADFTQLLARVPGAPSPPPSARPRVVSVGRRVEKKGFDVLVEAVALLQADGVAMDVVLAGEDGDQSGAVRALVAARGLAGTVQVCGPWSQSRLLAEYRRSTVFVLACRIDGDGDRDGIPNVLVEAMAAGLPVVSTAVSGIPELVTDGCDGLLVPPEDPARLAAAIRALVASPEDRARLSCAGRVTVANRFDGDVLAGRLATLFRQVAS
jgi:glycosyltransferase involved in cell wall biosynthesis